MRRFLQLSALALAAWLATWHLAAATTFWLVTAWLVGRPRRWRAWAAWALVGVVLVPWSVLGYQQRHDVLANRVLQEGPEALSLHDRVAVYGLNLAMATAGAVLGMPEVAAETAALVVPHPAGTSHAVSTRRFPLCVPEVARAASNQNTMGRSTSPSGRRITWTYDWIHTNVRGALALNPSNVVVVGEGDERMVRTTVPIDYPPRYRLVFARIGQRDLAVEEGLFHALEELGWLHPYELTWQTPWPEGTQPPPTCEAWSVRLARAVM